MLTKEEIWRGVTFISGEGIEDCVEADLGTIRAIYDMALILATAQEVAKTTEIGHFGTLRFTEEILNWLLAEAKKKLEAKP